MPWLIRVFAGRTLILLVLSCRGSYKRNCYNTCSLSEKLMFYCIRFFFFCRVYRSFTGLKYIGDEKNVFCHLLLLNTIIANLTKRHVRTAKKFGSAFLSIRWSHIVNLFEPRHEKTCLRGFRPGETQTGLLSYRDS